eukprot:TRINITY_DN2892_c0_g1_i2.p1 TRINITY_DN2892_c0_g1~~TRINITY_DN2892_c0_g1_i2.p1  ORF type:complete len:255 (+),score=43.73 TRINITY_DN2892_c0_g1_i2:42-806(+)
MGVKCDRVLAYVRFHLLQHMIAWIGALSCLGIAIFEAYHVIIPTRHTTPVKIVQEIITSIISASVLCTTPFILLLFLYGWKRVGFLLVFNIIGTVIISVLTYVFLFYLVINYPSITYLHCLLVIYFLWIAFIFANGIIFHFHEKKRIRLFPLYFSFPIVLSVAVFLLVNNAVILPLFTRSSVIIQSLIRIVFHTTFYFTLIFLMKYSARRLGSASAVIFTFLSIFLRAYMGRILNNEFDSYAVLFANTVAIVVA